MKVCGSCDRTDGLCYTSNPPKVRCTVTGNFHFYNDKCDIETASDAKKYILERLALERSFC